jgi:hypothetical protein
MNYYFIGSKSFIIPEWTYFPFANFCFFFFFFYFEAPNEKTTFKTQMSAETSRFFMRVLRKYLEKKQEVAVDPFFSFNPLPK